MVGRVSSRDCFKYHIQSRGSGENIIQLLKADYVPVFILHQNDLIARFLGNNFILEIAKPNSKSISNLTVDDFYLRHEITTLLQPPADK